VIQHSSSQLKSWARRVLLTFLLALSGLQAHANWIGHEGGEWLRWNRATKEVYLRAYIQENMQGYTLGCSNGLVAAQTTANATYSMQASQACSSLAPIASRGSTHFIDQVTAFYITYPRQR